jgi:NOL1/NOP2/fmu family ribosome biogenesis protein
VGSSGRRAGRAGLRSIHPGGWGGTAKGGRFEPSHALALGLRVEDARRAIILPAGHDDLLAYLRGESLRSPGEDGWTLVAVDGFPLGWGKRVAGVLKNHYPKGLRWP